ncbi:hypothetical protein VTG60DRAFT_1029 [Thermothelomyces hinnuleus]
MFRPSIEPRVEESSMRLPASPLDGGIMPADGARDMEAQGCVGSHRKRVVSPPCALPRSRFLSLADIELDDALNLSALPFSYLTLDARKSKPLDTACRNPTVGSRVPGAVSVGHIALHVHRLVRNVSTSQASENMRARRSAQGLLFQAKSFWWVTHNPGRSEVRLVSLSKGTSAISPQRHLPQPPECLEFIQLPNDAPAAQFLPASSDKRGTVVKFGTCATKASTSSEAPFVCFWARLRMLTQHAMKDTGSRFLHGDPVMCPEI